MIVNQRRYLPLFDENGTCIARPDLYLLARMGFDDPSYEESDVLHAYNVMCSLDPSRHGFTRLENDIHRRYVLADLRLRRYAGSVLLELLRIAASIEQPARLKDAIQLAARHQAEHDSGRHLRGLTSLIREMEKSFSRYRSTSHLQAALVYGHPTIDQIEASEEMTTLFLARARGIEQLADKVFEDATVTWNPWRVPEAISPIQPTEMIGLEGEELSFLGAKPRA